MQEKSINKSYILDSTTAILNKWSFSSVLIKQDYPAYELFKEALLIIWRFSVVLLFLDKRRLCHGWVIDANIINQARPKGTRF